MEEETFPMCPSKYMQFARKDGCRNAISMEALVSPASRYTSSVASLYVQNESASRKSMVPDGPFSRFQLKHARNVPLMEGSM